MHTSPLPKLPLTARDEGGGRMWCRKGRARLIRSIPRIIYSNSVSSPQTACRPAGAKKAAGPARESRYAAGSTRPANCLHTALSLSPVGLALSLGRLRTAAAAGGQSVRADWIGSRGAAHRQWGHVSSPGCLGGRRRPGVEGVDAAPGPKWERLFFPSLGLCPFCASLWKWGQRFCSRRRARKSFDLSGCISHKDLPIDVIMLNILFAVCLFYGIKY